jgi:prevent-host-death family protein
MREIGVFEAKTHFSALITDAIAGESTLITKNGKPVAQLTPATSVERERAARAAQRIRDMRGLLKLEPGESVRDLIDEGRE